MCGRVGGRSGRSSGACQATAEKTSSELAAGLQTRRRRHFTACLKEAALRHPSSKETGVDLQYHFRVTRSEPLGGSPSTIFQ